MESKTVKIIDEHGIDRNANVVCGFKVDGADYVLYWIERDGDNDNLFTSKVVKNNDGTFTMVNIEDSMEKAKVTELVKKLVTHAINDNASTLANGTVTLSDGTNVDVFATLFNKEQNINVSKTYITTVKKSVTKVSEDFYKVNNASTPVMNNEQPFFDAVKEAGKMPEIEAAITEPAAPAMPSVPQTPEVAPMPDTAVPEISVVPPVLETPEVKLEPTIPEEVAVPDLTANIPSIPEPVQAPIPEVESTPVVEPAPVVAPVPPVVESAPIPAPAPVPETPVADTVPVFDMSTPTPAAPVASPLPGELVLDGSKETNLAGTLGEVNNDAAIPVENVSALREFGQSDIAPQVESPAPVEPVTNSGFANNKYFLIVAFVFFVASCAFLGYEVYKYLQIK